MKKTPFLCVLAALAAPLSHAAEKPAAPATPPGLPAAPAAAPELSPEEAKKRLSYAIGGFFANRQKGALSADEKLDYGALQKGLADVLKADSKSYALGAQFAGQLTSDGIEINADDLIAAFKAVLDGGAPLLTEEESRAEMQKLQSSLQQKQQEAQAKVAAKHEAEGQEFLEKNKTAEGVVVTESGLQYKVLEPSSDANAPKPAADDTVACHYRGTLLDGTEFDKSPDGETRSFALNRVIKGWTEGIALMPVGSKYRFWIPAALAYGNNPRRGGVIRPGDTLVFDVELARIEPKTASPPQPKAVSQPVKLEPGEKAAATTPPIAVEMKDGKPVIRQVTPEEEAAAKKKAEEAAKEKKAE